METHTELTTTVAEDRLTPLERAAHLELAEDGYDLPELADTMEEADARATASTYLFAVRGVTRQLDANDAEFTVLQDYNRARHVERQRGLIRSVEYLRGAVRTLFGFMHIGKKKSLNLIGGRVGMRAQTDELVVEDDDAVVEWVKANQVTMVKPIVKIKLVLDRTALRAFMEANKHAAEATPRRDIEPPPGVTLKARPDKFYATPAKD